MITQVLGTRVDVLNRDDSLDLITSWITSSGKTRVISTAYSEFFVDACRDRDFAMALEGSDLVTADGVGPLSAIRYSDIVSRLSFDIFHIRKIFAGLWTGVDILRGRVGETVSGYWLFNQLIRKSVDEGWKVYLLGGWGDTAERLVRKLKTENKGLVIEFDKGAQTSADLEGVSNDLVITRLNQFKPDLLFVAYGPGKQEKWLMRNRDKLKAKVCMGVGGTFDEALGLVREAPVFFQKSGLKWFWRLLQQPARLPRIFKATFVFAFMVFVDSLRGNGRME